MTIRLRPLVVDDFEWAYRLAASDRAISRFRFRGWTPNPGRLDDVLFDAVHVQFVVEDAGGRGPRLGLVSSYRFDPRNQTTRIAAVFSDQAAGVVLGGMVALLRYLFSEFPLRQVYFEGLESNLTPLTTGALGRYVEPQGRLVEAEWHDGRWADTLVLRLTRERLVEAVASEPLVQRWIDTRVGFADPIDRSDRSASAVPEAVRRSVEDALTKVGLDPAGVRFGSPLAELGVDSLMLVEIISLVEADLSIAVSDEDFRFIVTGDDLLAALVDAR